MSDGQAYSEILERPFCGSRRLRRVGFPEAALVRHPITICLSVSVRLLAPSSQYFLQKDGYLTQHCEQITNKIINQ